MKDACLKSVRFNIHIKIEKNHFNLDEDEDTLGPEGMEKFCEDIGVEPENVSTCIMCISFYIYTHLCK